MNKFGFYINTFSTFFEKTLKNGPASSLAVKSEPKSKSGKRRRKKEDKGGLDDPGLTGVRTFVSIFKQIIFFFALRTSLYIWLRIIKEQDSTALELLRIVFVVPGTTRKYIVMGFP